MSSAAMPRKTDNSFGVSMARLTALGIWADGGQRHSAGATPATPSWGWTPKSAVSSWHKFSRSNPNLAMPSADHGVFRAENGHNLTPCTSICTIWVFINNMPPSGLGCWGCEKISKVQSHIMGPTAAHVMIMVASSMWKCTDFVTECQKISGILLQ